MNQFNIGDRVRAVKDCVDDQWFHLKGQKGTVKGINENFILVYFDSGFETPARFHEIELIESEPTTQNPFPTFNEFINELVKADPRHKERFCYNYFAQFGKQPSQPNSKPFPTFEEFDTWYCETEPVKNNGECKWTQQVYDYLVQFGVREVFPEVGKEYEFSEDGENWRRDTFESYESNNSIGFTHIRPIQPSRLEQLMAKHPNLTDTEQKELLHLLLTQNKQNK